MPGVLIHIEEDLEFDIHKLDAIADEALDDGKKAVKLGKDVIAVSEHWKQALTSGSYLVSQLPEIIDALEDCGSLASHSVEIIGAAAGGNILATAADGRLIERDLEEGTIAMKKLYHDRQELFHSVITLERWAHNVVSVVKKGKEFCDKHDRREQEKMERAKQGIPHRLMPKKHHLQRECTRKATAKRNANIAHTNNSAATHISIKDEAELFAKKIDDKVTDLVHEGEDVEKFLMDNKEKIETFAKDIEQMKTDWKPAVQAVAGLQSVIPLSVEAFHEITAIAKLVKDAFGAAFLNPVAILGLIEDGREVFDDTKAIYAIFEQIESILHSLEVLKLFVAAAGDALKKGRTLLESMRTIESSDVSAKK
mmetsp:Transcript_17454/g.25793  ORF Transcript_17454/g.25793 Transcript_17454/m.25793 type:complete len:367 (-) Transcript_17454:250-1350(-)|eukprot:CAMPEP_0194217328 /NCGR_PEP_ID=MMETSP0156-20130528/20998_1 /TAXON_ID=33649 /ORGANISM="Thalassionema nitzschioides, Strain L26-B" /LENGTH=366 /DNA_ID=CAMNT_0038946347 /DNA_START=24 /DNA_END=1124 /DNA_ORIENTATION=-